MKKIYKYNVHPRTDEDGEIYFVMEWRILGRDFEWKTIAPLVSSTLDKIKKKIKAIKEDGGEVLYDEAL